MIAGQTSSSTFSGQVMFDGKRVLVCKSGDANFVAFSLPVVLVHAFSIAVCDFV